MDKRRCTRRSEKLLTQSAAAAASSMPAGSGHSPNKDLQVKANRFI